MSTAELIYEKSKELPGRLQTEALSFVEYLSRRRAAQVESDEWKRLMAATQGLSTSRSITDEDIAAEIATYRASQ